MTGGRRGRQARAGGEPGAREQCECTTTLCAHTRRCTKSVTSGQAISPLYFRGGVTPAGSGTCATFSVIDTRL